MVPTMLKRIVMCAVLTVWMFGVSGCVNQSDYDAKVAEVKNQGELLAKAEEKATRAEEKATKGEEKSAQLQKDLDTAKGDAEKSEQAKKDAEAKIKTLEQQNAELKDQAKTLEQKNIGLKTKAEEKTAQLQKDLDAAKGDAEKADLAKRDADAKIKTLEQENADFKKRGPTPVPEPVQQ